MCSKNTSLFLKTLDSGRILFLDGAMGTLLQAAGMPPGMEPAAFCLDNPDILLKIHMDYLEAGSDIITTCTFGANSYKLPKGMDVFETNRKLALIAREAADRAAEKKGHPVFVAGDMGPCGQFAIPLGKEEPEAITRAFEDQAAGLAAGGVDLIFLETEFDIAELRNTVVGARRACQLPVLASMTFERGISLTGSTPEIFIETAQNLGLAAAGTNCSLGPDEMLPVVRELLSASSVPILVEPNAGLPELRDGKTIFPLGPEEFAEKTARFAEMGAQILGGCCGTTPAHIKSLVRHVSGMEIKPRMLPEQNGICLTSRSRLVRIGRGHNLVIIGERINPTGKPELASELAKGEFKKALEFADEQIDSGASVLDINVGAPMADETRLLAGLVRLLQDRQLVPLSLDSSNTEAIARALPYYPASCLVNSISGEPGRMETLGPLCRDYGAPFILLPIRGAELPETASERIAILEKLLDAAFSMRIPKRLVLIDPLVLAASSNAEAGRACLETLRWCSANGYATTMGLSNISFGLPARGLLNSVFLALARGAGLDSCIANPAAPRLKETVDAMETLLGHDRDCQNFIASYAKWSSGQPPAKDETRAAPQESSLYNAVLHGRREEIDWLVERELANGREAFSLVENALIPAINEVGELYGKGEYFLPQLIRSAEAMQAAITLLQPLLEKAGKQEKRPVIVMATVQGDIHDIGKKIVSLLLGNHGFEVVDAGKDVPAEKIVELAEKTGAAIIGLSALMTTTMVRMVDTIKLVQKRKLPVRVMVGGAAVTPDFARSIGADAYCADAVESVRQAKIFVNEQNMQKSKCGE